MRVYNTLTRKKEEFIPLEEGKVKMYACGITVSGEAHVGHGYQALIYDVMRKYLEKRGYKVTYARNYTDVDDKIIARSNEAGVPADIYAAEMIKTINAVMAEFGVDDPTLWLKATENIGNIIKFIARLIDSGHAYPAPNGDVYFSVSSFKRYGCLSNRSVEDMLELALGQGQTGLAYRVLGYELRSLRGTDRYSRRRARPYFSPPRERNCADRKPNGQAICKILDA